MENQPHYLDEINILIVDDSKTSSMLIRQQIVSLGVKYDAIESVTSYQETIKAVGLRHYDLLIMDYHLEQSLNGHELTTLLYKNRLIDSSTGVLIISGDSRQETVLTSLSGKVKHFISKPIKTQDLHNKVKTIVRERELLNQIEPLLKHPTPQLTGKLIELVEQLNFQISLESSLIDLLIQHELWDTLAEYLAHSQSSKHPTKVYAQAALLDMEGRTDEALKYLSDYIVQKPLSLNVMDYLSVLYEQQGDTEEALHWALKSFEFTPSVSDRAIRASQLSAKLNKRESVIKVGYTFANHLSLADGNWLHAIIEYGHSLEAVYINTERFSSKRELLQHFNNFLKMAEQRLLGNKKGHLISYRLMFQSRLLLHENKLEGSHKKILQCIAPYYDNLMDCPAEIAHEALPILELFGELWLHNHLSKVLQKQLNSVTKTSTDLLTALPFDVEHLKELYEILPEGGSRATDLETIAIYETIIHRYPYSTEAKIRYLHAVRVSQEIPNHNPHALITTLSDLELPPNWSRWVTSLKKVGTKAAPPAPFSAALNT